MSAKRLDDGYAAMAKLHKVRAHPVRLRILEVLVQCGEACVCHITAALGRRQPYTSQQPAILREAGLIAERRDGTLVYYRLADEQVPAVIAASANGQRPGTTSQCSFPP